jgi:ABC-type antimicrobial peptide transport system permease subunit
MTLKQKAISQTIAIILGIVGGSLLLNVMLFYTPLIIVQYALSAILIGFMVYVVYGVVLSRLEYTEKLEQINSKT